MGTAYSRAGKRAKRKSKIDVRGRLMIGSREEAIALDYALSQVNDKFRMRFEDAEVTTQFYYKDRAGKYHEVDTWLVPYKTAELIHSDIVRPLVLQIAMELKKIEAYELPYKKEENATKE